MTPRFRLAPTPSGFLHRGNAINFLLNAAWARVLAGKLILRVDDLDAARVRPQYLANILDTVSGLFEALNWSDEFWKRPVLQSQRLASYRAALDELRRRKLVYACTCSRREVRAAQERVGNFTAYPGTCRNLNLSLGTARSAWRLRTAPGTVAEWTDALSGEEHRVAVDDFVLRQRNGQPSYQLAATVDDVELDITHVVRGRDLLTSTAMQRVLGQALGDYGRAAQRIARIHYWHHGLLLDEGGRKLSKSAGAKALKLGADTRLSGDNVTGLARRTLGLVPARATTLRRQLELWAAL